ncbi:hypothetical protein AGMMS49940_08160 [Spirochaetia bacterium]|nr:hypothetical protein AGMMS49940_08160 [Spirochaetia bacterium]
MNKTTCYLLPSITAVILGTLLALPAGVLVTGCKSPTGSESGEGLLTITVGKTARTLYPAQSLFTRYELSFPSGPKGAPMEAISFTEGTTKTVELRPGIWIITVTAFAGTAGFETASARGTIADVIITAGETTTKHLNLTPIAGGAEGFFSYSIEFPNEAVDSAVLTITTTEGAAVDGGPVNLMAIPPTEGKRTGTISLPAGYYLMNIQLRGVSRAGKTEVVHIYSGLTTQAAYTFTYDDLSPPISPGILIISIGFNYGAITITGSDGTNLLSKTGALDKSTTLTFSVQSDAGYSDIVWYMDGQLVPGAVDGSLTLHAVDYGTPNHSAIFTGKKDGIPYSQAIPFVVIQDDDPLSIASPYTLTVPLEAEAIQAEVQEAVHAAKAALFDGGVNPEGPGDGEAWTVRIIGLNLSGNSLAHLYTGLAASLNGDINLNLSACTGGSIGSAGLTGTAEEQEAILNRFITINLGKSLSTIKNGSGGATGAFRGFTRLTWLRAPGLTTVGSYAFYHCAGLITVELPKVTKFGTYTFNGCTALNAIKLGENPPAFGTGTFTGLKSTNTVTLTIPADTKTTYDAAYSGMQWGGTNVAVKIVER